MITGKVLIDGVDIKSTYGAYIVEEGYDDVPSLPAMKSPEKNDWFESNSVDIDLSSPCFESQKISFKMMMNGTTERAQSLIDFLMSKRTHAVEMVDIGRERVLRIVDVSAGGLSSIFNIRVNMYDDDPRGGIEYVAPSSFQRNTGLTIDGIDVSKYGALMTGSTDGLFPDVKMKDNKLVDSKHIDGELHSTGTSVYVERDDIKVRLVVRSDSMTDFWEKRDALLLDLTKPGERIVSWKGKEAKAYYKNCNTINFFYFGRFWWEFELTFGCIGE